MKYVRKFESFRKMRDAKPVNEDIFGIGGALKELFGKLWDSVVGEMKKTLGENPDAKKIKVYLDQNILNPNDNSFLLKDVVGKNSPFFKSTEANEQSCLDLIKQILDPQVGSLGKAGLQKLYDGLLKNFGKEVPTLDIVRFYLETIRNRAIKDYKYAGGPDFKVGTDAKVDEKKIIVDMKDTTHLPDFKKLIATAKNNVERKNKTLDWVNKTLVVRLDKYLSEIKEEDVKKYVESLGKEIPESNYKQGDLVIYKRDKFVEDEWKKVTEEDKKKPNEGAIKDLQDKEMIGIKKIKDIKGDVVSFEDAEFTKKTSDLLDKLESNISPGQDALTNTLKEVKAKDAKSIEDLNDIASLYKDPVANADKIEKIKAIANEGK